MLIVEENYECGGHGIVTGGNVNLGGGTTRQKAHGVEDSPDQVFECSTRPQNLESRYTDRDLARVFADTSAETFEWMKANGVKLEDTVAGPDDRSGPAVQWPVYEKLITSYPTWKGSGLVRAPEKSAADEPG